MEFLSQIASAYYKAEGQGIKEFCFVFPNRRAGLFFQKQIGDIATEPLFSPAIMTIKDLFSLLSGLNSIDRLDSLFKLFKIYIELSGSKETFDEFLFWGDVILGDFDDVDKYLVDAKRLFANVKDLKEIGNDYSFLSKKQLEAVQTFWSNFLPVGESEKKEKFRATWEILYPLYLKFKEVLENAGLGYEGMIYRKTAEAILDKGDNIHSVTDKLSMFKGVVFVGFNALSACEKVLLETLKKAGKADFYWDFSGELITDVNNKSSLFMRENIIRFPSRFKLDLSPTFPCEIEVIGVPSAVGEARMVSRIVSKVGGGLNSAVVLPDESLLMPVLYSIPQEVESVNVTMGYPLKFGSVVSLMQSIMELQKGPFYYRRVLPVLRHHYIKMVAKEKASLLMRKIVESNMVYVNESEFHEHPLLKMIFRHAPDVSAYMLEILEYLNNSAELTKIEKEFVYFFYTAVSRLGDLQIPVNIDTYCKLLMQIVNSTSIPFKGEPLAGLQIMGVLETRALDFDNIIICSMNDGVFPSKAPANSFIPFNLRKGFGLPDYEFKDGVTAYHFYRLICRASKVFLLYDTRSEGMQTGEMSRFIHQLKYHYQLPLKESIATFKVTSHNRDAIVIEKSPAISETVSDLFLKGGKGALSASSINTFIDCPLKFYFQFVKGVAEEESVSEEVEADTFGSIFHKTIELLYQDYKGKTVSCEMLDKLYADIPKIEKAVADAFYNVLKINEIKGRNLLIQKLIIRYIQQTIFYDKRIAPFEYVNSEQKYRYDFTLENGMVVALKGFFDRIDRRNGVTRIVDYKTGKGGLSFRTLEDLFDTTSKSRNKIAFQMILYALMIDSKDSVTISPYLLRELFRDTDLEMVVDKEILEEFSILLNSTLMKIFDSGTPFIQTEDLKKCEYCPYSVICR